MKERPILFSAPMVRAVLAGTKTQTRRIAKGVHIVHEHTGEALAQLDSAGPRISCPYGQPGDRLWVREAFATTCERVSDGVFRERIIYRAYRDQSGMTWRPSIHMPRWASRITLEITSVRVERLQEISEADAIAEGIKKTPHGFWSLYGQADVSCTYSPRASFRALWESINGPDSWDANPWLWVVEFKRVEAKP